MYVGHVPTYSRHQHQPATTSQGATTSIASLNEHIIFEEIIATAQPLYTWDSQTLAWLATHSPEKLTTKLQQLSPSQKTQLNRLMIIIELAFDDDAYGFGLRLSYSGIKELLTEIFSDCDDYDVKAFLGLYVNHAMLCYDNSNVTTEFTRSSQTEYAESFSYIIVKLKNVPIWFRYTDRMFVILANRNLSNIRFVDENGGRLNAGSADLSNTYLFGSRIKGLDLSKANLSGAHLVNCDFLDANMAGCDLSGATFKDCIFSNTNLSGARLAGTRFSNTKLYNIQFSEYTQLSTINFIERNPRQPLNFMTLKLFDILDIDSISEIVKIINSLNNFYMKLLLIAQLYYHVQLSLYWVNQPLASELLRQLDEQYKSDIHIGGFIYYFKVEQLTSVKQPETILAKRINSDSSLGFYKLGFMRLIYLYILRHIIKGNKDFFVLIRQVEERLNTHGSVMSYYYRMIYTAHYFSSPTPPNILQIKCIFKIIVEEMHKIQDNHIREGLMGNILSYLVDKVLPTNKRFAQSLYSGVLDAINSLPQDKQIYDKIISRYKLPK